MIDSWAREATEPEQEYLQKLIAHHLSEADATQFEKLDVRQIYEPSCLEHPYACARVLLHFAGEWNGALLSLVYSKLEVHLDTPNLAAWPKLWIHPGYFANWKHRSHEIFRINADTIRDYIQFIYPLFLGHRTVLVETPEDVAWYSPLIEGSQGERRALEQQIAPIQITKSETLESGTDFHVAACCLNDDRLNRITFRIADHHRFGMLGRIEQSMGEFVDDKAETLVEGLPRNWYSPPDQLPGAAIPYSSCSRAAEPGWEWVNVLERRCILKDVNRQVMPPFDINHALLKRQPLSFYPNAYLYELREDDKDFRTIRFVWSPGHTALLDGTSEHIHTYNNEAGVHLTAETVKDYLRFFCDYLYADEGPFSIIDSAEHPRFRDPVTGDLLLPQHQLEEVRNRIEAVALEEKTELQNDGQTAYFLTGTVWYSNSFFKCRFIVKTNGAVEMLEDEQGCKIDSVGNFVPQPNPFDVVKHNWLSETHAVLPASILAEDPDRLCRSGGLANVVVTGTLHLSGSQISRPIRIQNCIFRGDVDLSSLMGGAMLEIDSCLFDGQCSLTSARLKGNCEIRRSFFACDGDRTGSTIGASLDLRQLTAQSLSCDNDVFSASFFAADMSLKSDANLVNLLSHKSLEFDRAKVDGFVRLRSAPGTRIPFHVAANANFAYLNAHAVEVSGVQVYGCLSFNYALIHQFFFMSYAGTREDRDTFRPNRIGHAPGAPTDNLEMLGMVIEKNQCILSGLDVAGNVDMRGLRLGTSLRIGEKDVHAPSRIGGNLWLDNTVAPSDIYFYGLKVDGCIRAKGISTQRLHCMPLHIDGKTRHCLFPDTGCSDSEQPPCLTMQGGARLEPMEVGVAMEFSQSNIASDVLIFGVRCLRSYNTSDIYRYGLILRQSHIGGNLKLFLTDYEIRRDMRHIGLPKQPDDHKFTNLPICHFAKGINLRKARIEGDVIFTGVQCTQGEIDLDDVCIKRDLRFSHDDRIAAGPHYSRARLLRISSADCGGDVDLSSLELLGTGYQNSQSPGGSVLGQQLTVGGTLRISGPKRHGRIPGKLDLELSRLGELQLSHDGFHGGCTAAALEQQGIILRKSTIGVLTVYTDGKAFPCPIDLSFMDVRWWDFLDPRGVDQGHQRPADEAQKYIGFIGQDPCVQRHTYRAVEQTLINHGHIDAADRVHIAMRRTFRDRLLLTESNVATRNPLVPLGRRLIWGSSWLWDKATAYGTASSRLLLIVFVWLIFSSYFFSISRNIGPSEEGYAAMTNSRKASVTTPDPVHWGAIDGFWIALRYHIPIISLSARDEWEPTTDAPMQLTRSGLTTSSLGLSSVSAEDYAYIVSALHWLLLPFIVFTLSRKILRNRSVE